jgi:hypothetical protein
MAGRGSFDNPYDEFVPHRENTIFDSKNGKVCI